MARTVVTLGGHVGREVDNADAVLIRHWALHVVRLRRGQLTRQQRAVSTIARSANQLRTSAIQRPSGVTKVSSIKPAGTLTATRAPFLRSRTGHIVRGHQCPVVLNRSAYIRSVTCVTRGEVRALSHP
jgi:hypothetical protein